MSTELRKRASRQNGKRSRGPVTADGKAASARNSLRHGLLADCITLNEEDRDAFLAFLAELHDDFQPQNAHERSLVENMAVCRWRQMRIWAMEKAGLAHEMTKHTFEPDIPTRASLAFRSLSDNSRSLELINRYEARFDRQYCRAYNTFFSKRT